MTDGSGLGVMTSFLGSRFGGGARRNFFFSTKTNGGKGMIDRSREETGVGAYALYASDSLSLKVELPVCLVDVFISECLARPWRDRDSTAAWDAVCFPNDIG